jgi:hypothetical protein
MNRLYTEEVAANCVGTGADVSLPPAVEPPGIPASKKKRKKIKENYITESGGKVIDQLKQISMGGQQGVIVFDNGEKKQISAVNASKIVDLYRNLNASNRVKMIKSVNSSASGLDRIMTFASTRV